VGDEKDKKVARNGGLRKKQKYGATRLLHDNQSLQMCFLLAVSFNLHSILAHLAKQISLSIRPKMKLKTQEAVTCPKSHI
jgi:hypothetical protein